MSTAHGPNDPVIVGVGQFVDREGGVGREDGDPPRSPVDLMTEALERALSDAGPSFPVARTEVVAVVPTFSWRYRDPGRLLAARLGLDGASTWYATMGGNTPQKLLNRLGREIAAGRLDQAVLCGGEAGRTRSSAKRAGIELDWVRQGDDVTPDWHDGGEMLLGDPAEVALGIVMPTQAYPLFETALWHDSGRTLDEHLDSVGELWSGLSRVAASNPFAWHRAAYTAAEITTPSAENRLVGFPYTKRMVANPDVDMSSALVVCSARRAEEIGVPRGQWVFLHSGADGEDPNMSHRPDFVSSPAIDLAGNRALELAGVGIDDVAHLDLYSCFPSAVQLAMRELDITADRRLTVYGGLCFAGGPWNNPVGHALASMVSVLREDPGSRGLVTANGGNVDKHAFGVLSTDPPAAGFRWESLQDRIDAVGSREVRTDHLGPVTVEAWTVMHERDGSPARAHAACRTPDGARVWGVSDDPELMKRFVTEDVGGAPAELRDESRLELL